MTSRTWPSAAAIALVLATGLLLLATRPAPRSVAEPPARIRVVGAAASFEVSGKWVAQPVDTVFYYADAAGRPIVGLSGAVVADQGSCAGVAGSNRGFAGFGAPGPGDLASVQAAAVRRWSAGISGRARSPRRTERLRLVDGTPAVRTRARLRAVPDDDPCTAARVALDLVSLDTRAGVVTFVLVRDVDPRGVPDAEADAIVQSLRSRT